MENSPPVKVFGPGVFGNLRSHSADPSTSSYNATKQDDENVSPREKKKRSKSALRSATKGLGNLLGARTSSKNRSKSAQPSESSHGATNQPNEQREATREENAEEARSENRPDPAAPSDVRPRSKSRLRSVAKGVGNMMGVRQPSKEVSPNTTQPNVEDLNEQREATREENAEEARSENRPDPAAPSDVRPRSKSRLRSVAKGVGNMMGVRQPSKEVSPNTTQPNVEDLNEQREATREETAEEAGSENRPDPAAPRDVRPRSKSRLRSVAKGVGNMMGVRQPSKEVSPNTTQPNVEDLNEQREATREENAEEAGSENKPDPAAPRDVRPRSKSRLRSVAKGVGNMMGVRQPSKDGRRDASSTSNDRATTSVILQSLHNPEPAKTSTDNQRKRAVIKGKQPMDNILPSEQHVVTQGATKSSDWSNNNPVTTTRSDKGLLGNNRSDTSMSVLVSDSILEHATTTDSGPEQAHLGTDESQFSIPKFNSDASAHSNDAKKHRSKSIVRSAAKGFANKIGARRPKSESRKTEVQLSKDGLGMTVETPRIEPNQDETATTTHIHEEKADDTASTTSLDTNQTNNFSKNSKGANEYDETSAEAGATGSDAPDMTNSEARKKRRSKSYLRSAVKGLGNALGTRRPSSEPRSHAEGCRLETTVTITENQLDHESETKKETSDKSKRERKDKKEKKDKHKHNKNNVEKETDETELTNENHPQTSTYGEEPTSKREKKEKKEKHKRSRSFFRKKSVTAPNKTSCTDENQSQPTSEDTSTSDKEKTDELKKEKKDKKRAKSVLHSFKNGSGNKIGFVGTGKGAVAPIITDASTSKTDMTIFSMVKNSNVKSVNQRKLADTNTQNTEDHDSSVSDESDNDPVSYAENTSKANDDAEAFENQGEATENTAVDTDAALKDAKKKKRSKSVMRSTAKGLGNMMGIRKRNRSEPPHNTIPPKTHGLTEHDENNDVNNVACTSNQSQEHDDVSSNENDDAETSEVEDAKENTAVDTDAALKEAKKKKRSKSVMRSTAKGLGNMMGIRKRNRSEPPPNTMPPKTHGLTEHDDHNDVNNVACTSNQSQEHDDVSSNENDDAETSENEDAKENTATDTDIDLKNAKTKKRSKSVMRSTAKGLGNMMGIRKRPKSEPPQKVTHSPQMPGLTEHDGDTDEQRKDSGSAKETQRQTTEEERQNKKHSKSVMRSAAKGVANRLGIREKRDQRQSNADADYEESIQYFEGKRGMNNQIEYTWAYPVPETKTVETEKVLPKAGGEMNAQVQNSKTLMADEGESPANTDAFENPAKSEKLKRSKSKDKVKKSHSKGVNKTHSGKLREKEKPSKRRNRSSGATINAPVENNEQMTETDSASKKKVDKKTLREKSSSPMRSAAKGVANLLGLRTPSRKRRSKSTDVDTDTAGNHVGAAMAPDLNADLAADTSQADDNEKQPPNESDDCPDIPDAQLTVSESSSLGDGDDRPVYTKKLDLELVDTFNSILNDTNESKPKENTQDKTLKMKRNDANDTNDFKPKENTQDKTLKIKRNDANDTNDSKPKENTQDKTLKIKQNCAMIKHSKETKDETQTNHNTEKEMIKSGPSEFKLKEKKGVDGIDQHSSGAIYSENAKRKQRKSDYKLREKDGVDLFDQETDDSETWKTERAGTGEGKSENVKYEYKLYEKNGVDMFDQDTDDSETGNTESAGIVEGKLEFVDMFDKVSEDKSENRNTKTDKGENVKYEYKLYEKDGVDMFDQDTDEESESEITVNTTKCKENKVPIENVNAKPAPVTDENAVHSSIHGTDKEGMEITPKQTRHSSETIDSVQKSTKKAKRKKIREKTDDSDKVIIDNEIKISKRPAQEKKRSKRGKDPVDIDDLSPDVEKSEASLYPASNTNQKNNKKRKEKYDDKSDTENTARKAKDAEIKQNSGATKTKKKLGVITTKPKQDLSAKVKADEQRSSDEDEKLTTALKVGDENENRNTKTDKGENLKSEYKLYEKDGSDMYDQDTGEESESEITVTTTKCKEIKANIGNVNGKPAPITEDNAVYSNIQETDKEEIKTPSKQAKHRSGNINSAQKSSKKAKKKKTPEKTDDSDKTPIANEIKISECPAHDKKRSKRVKEHLDADDLSADGEEPEASLYPESNTDKQIKKRRRGNKDKNSDPEKTARKANDTETNQISGGTKKKRGVKATNIQQDLSDKVKSGEQPSSDEDEKLVTTLKVGVDELKQKENVTENKSAGKTKKSKEVLATRGDSKNEKKTSRKYKMTYNSSEEDDSQSQTQIIKSTKDTKESQKTEAKKTNNPSSDKQRVTEKEKVHELKQKEDITENKSAERTKTSQEVLATRGDSKKEKKTSRKYMGYNSPEEDDSQSQTQIIKSTKDTKESQRNEAKKTYNPSSDKQRVLEKENVHELKQKENITENKSAEKTRTKTPKEVLVTRGDSKKEKRISRKNNMTNNSEEDDSQSQTQIIKSTKDAKESQRNETKKTNNPNSENQKVIEKVKRKPKSKENARCSSTTAPETENVHAETANTDGEEIKTQELSLSELQIARKKKALSSQKRAQRREKKEKEVHETDISCSKQNVFELETNRPQMIQINSNSNGTITIDEQLSKARRQRQIEKGEEKQEVNKCVLKKSKKPKKPKRKIERPLLNKNKLVTIAEEETNVQAMEVHIVQTSNKISVPDMSAETQKELIEKFSNSRRQKRKMTAKETHDDFHRNENIGKEKENKHERNFATKKQNGPDEKNKASRRQTAKVRTTEKIEEQSHTGANKSDEKRIIKAKKETMDSEEKSDNGFKSLADKIEAVINRCTAKKHGQVPEKPTTSGANTEKHTETPTRLVPDTWWGRNTHEFRSAMHTRSINAPYPKSIECKHKAALQYNSWEKYESRSSTNEATIAQCDCIECRTKTREYLLFSTPSRRPRTAFNEKPQQLFGSLNRNHTPKTESKYKLSPKFDDWWGSYEDLDESIQAAKMWKLKKQQDTERETKEIEDKEIGGPIVLQNQQPDLERVTQKIEDKKIDGVFPRTSLEPKHVPMTAKESTIYETPDKVKDTKNEETFKAGKKPTPIHSHPQRTEIESTQKTTCAQGRYPSNLQEEVIQATQLMRQEQHDQERDKVEELIVKLLDVSQTTNPDYAAFIESLVKLIEITRKHSQEEYKYATDLIKTISGNCTALINLCSKMIDNKQEDQSLEKEVGVSKQNIKEEETKSILKSKTWRHFGGQSERLFNTNEKPMLTGILRYANNMYTSDPDDQDKESIRDSRPSTSYREKSQQPRGAPSTCIPLTADDYLSTENRRCGSCYTPMIQQERGSRRDERDAQRKARTQTHDRTPESPHTKKLKKEKIPKKKRTSEQIRMPQCPDAASGLTSHNVSNAGVVCSEKQGTNVVADETRPRRRNPIRRFFEKLFKRKN